MVQKLARTVVWSLSATMGVTGVSASVEAALAALAPPAAAAQPATTPSAATTTTTSTTTPTGSTTTTTTEPVSTTTTTEPPATTAKPVTTTKPVSTTPPTTTPAAHTQQPSSPTTTAPRVPLAIPPSTTTSTSTTTTLPPTTTTTTTVPPATPPATTSPTSAPVTSSSAAAATNPTASLWLANADGTVSELGSSAPAPQSKTKPAGGPTAMAATPDGAGYWLVNAAGAVVSEGDAATYGDAPSENLHPARVVGIASTADGRGYWLVDAQGGVLAFGDATAYGSMAGHTLNRPIVGIAATPDGLGYWLVGADGGVFAFGDATFKGTAVNPQHPLTDIVGVSPTLDGKGYWLLGADGAVFSYGDAKFQGALTAQMPATHFVGLTPTLDGGGYWLTAADGAVVALGDAQAAGTGTLLAGTAGTTPPPTQAALPAGLSANAAISSASGPLVSTTPATQTTTPPSVTAAATPTAGSASNSAAATSTATTSGPVYTSTVVTTAPTSTTAGAAAPVALVSVAPANRLVPASYVNWDVQAAASCPGLSWTVLAGIASVESDFGQSTLPGVHSGQNSAGAAGPMQFLAGTFAAYDHPVAADETPTPAEGAVPPSTYDAVDAIWAAARLLCAQGAGNPANVSTAVYAYNHSSSYVTTVETLAASYAGSTSASPVALTALNAALSQQGVPYVWGGETVGQAFDCSGLVQWAYRTAGVTIPRTTQTMWAELPHLAASTPLQPGDLVYYGPNNGPTHVGMYIGGGRMVDAPYTGVDVRIDPVDTGENYVGAIRPADLVASVTSTGA